MIGNDISMVNFEKKNWGLRYMVDLKFTNFYESFYEIKNIFTKSWSFNGSIHTYLIKTLE